MKKGITIILCLLSWANFLIAQNDPMEMFQAGNEAYKAKKFSEAIQQYENIYEGGLRSGELHYNLGNSYYRNGQIGAAILNYERALVLDPGNKDVRFNLGITRDKQLDDISEIPKFFGTRWWNGLMNIASSSTWSSFGLLLLWLGIGGMILWLLAKERALKKKSFLVGISLLLICILPFLLSWSKKKVEQDSGIAILLEKEIPFRTAPDEESVEILLLHEGAKLDVVDQIGEWYKVRLMNGEEGWLPLTALEKI